MSGAKGLTQTLDLPLHITKELCAGKVYIVTGANVGLGLEAARHLVAIGASRVIMAVRNLSAGEAARNDIEASTGIKGVAEVWHLDLSSYDSVRSFVGRAAEELERIEAVIENAAVAGTADVWSEGHLNTMTVNVTSTFLMAMLLLPKLRADAVKFKYNPRLVIVSSGAAFDLKEYWMEISDDPYKKMDEDKEIGMKQ